MFRRVIVLVASSALGVAIAVGMLGCGTVKAGAGSKPAVRPGAASAAGPRKGVRGHWATQPAPANMGRLNLMDIACGGAGSSCVAVGIACSSHGCGLPEPSAIITTANGGESWTRQPMPSGVGNLAAVSCATATQCVAAGDRAPFGQHSGAFLITKNGGANWSVVADPDLYSPAGISCPTVATCFAVGHSPRKSGAIAVSKNGGVNWTAEALPGSVGGLNAISCPSTSHCVALGFSTTGTSLALTTTNGGHGWTGHAIPNGSLTSVSCPAAATCFAVGVNESGTAGIVAASSNGGASWAVSTAPQGIGLSSISCPSALACAAVGTYPITQLRAIAITTTGGAAWTTVPAPAGQGNLFGVSCTPAGNCTAVGAWRYNSSIIEGPYIVSNQPS